MWFFNFYLCIKWITVVFYTMALQAKTDAYIEDDCWSVMLASNWVSSFNISDMNALCVLNSFLHFCNVSLCPFYSHVPFLYFLTYAVQLLPVVTHEFPHFFEDCVCFIIWPDNLLTHMMAFWNTAATSMTVLQFVRNLLAYLCLGISTLSFTKVFVFHCLTGFLSTYNRMRLNYAAITTGSAP